MTKRSRGPPTERKFAPRILFNPPAVRSPTAVLPRSHEMGPTGWIDREGPGRDHFSLRAGVGDDLPERHIDDVHAERGLIVARRLQTHHLRPGRERKPISARVLFWALVIATLGVYGAIGAWSAPAISAAADGQLIFDLRPAGYDLAEARAFLKALTPEGRTFYLQVQHRLDLAFPMLLAAATGWAMLRLLPRRRWWAVVLLLPMLAMIFDLLENAAVSRMLRAGADELTYGMVTRAGTFSQLKAVFSTLSLSLLLVLIVAWVMGRRRRIG